MGGPHTQRISIPLLTLVPLPLLQVKEADFDFDIQIVDALSADRDAAFSLKNGSAPEGDEGVEGVKLRVSMAQASREGRASEKASRSLTANMKVKVKMQQADMPGGLSNLLHLTTSNVQSESVDETEGKEVNDGQ